MKVELALIIQSISVEDYKKWFYIFIIIFKILIEENRLKAIIS